MVINQYAIVLVNLEPTLGHEIKKTRPCVVLSPNEMNRHLRTIVVGPMTTNLTAYPTRVPVVHNKKSVMVALDQIRTIDRQHIITVLGSLSETEVAKCKQVIQETFVD
jgi:mRNA interferase MazF